MFLVRTYLRLIHAHMAGLVQKNLGSVFCRMYKETKLAQLLPRPTALRNFLRASTPRRGFAFECGGLNSCVVHNPPKPRGLLGGLGSHDCTSRKGLG